MANIIILVVLGFIIGGAVWHVYKSWKSGIKCIGCPDGAACSGNCSGCTGCRSEK